MKKIKIISIFLVILMTFTACGTNFGDGFNLGKSQAISRTVYMIGYNFESENPLLVKNEVNREIFSLIYDGLYTLDENYKPVPKLAKDESVSNDGLVWTINLNTNAFFHDGTSLMANDVVSTINYLLSNSTYYNYNVSNIEKIEQKGSGTVIITLKKPAQNLQALLTFPIVNAKDLLGELKFNGTGMFIVDNYIKRKHIDLKVNDNYYDKKNEDIYKIEVQLMPDKETANYSYASGLSDVFSQDIFSNVNSLNPKAGASVIEYESLNYSFLLLNNNMAMFIDPVVRKAINMAIDRQKIVEDVLFSHAEAVIVPLPKGSSLCSKDIKVEYNVNEAKTLLIENGYMPDVNTGIMQKETDGEIYKLSFNIIVNSDNNFRIQTANYISDSLKYIGIDANVKIVDFNEYQSQYINRTYDAFLGSIAMSPDFDLSIFMGENNVSGYYSDSSLNVLRDISLTSDYDVKAKNYNKLQEIFVKDVPHISLYYTKVNLQHSKKIKKGLMPTGFNIYNNIENWSFE